MVLFLWNENGRNYIFIKNAVFKVTCGVFYV